LLTTRLPSLKVALTMSSAILCDGPLTSYTENSHVVHTPLNPAMKKMLFTHSQAERISYELKDHDVLRITSINVHNTVMFDCSCVSLDSYFFSIKKGFITS
jgi:hypothetical protein